MARVLFFLALLIAATSAFVAPSGHAVGPAFARTSSTVKMSPVDAVTEINSMVVQNSQVLATNADDFGGFFYPIVGLTLLGALILYLSPPLAGE